MAGAIAATARGDHPPADAGSRAPGATAPASPAAAGNRPRGAGRQPAATARTPGRQRTGLPGYLQPVAGRQPAPRAEPGAACRTGASPRRVPQMGPPERTDRFVQRRQFRRIAQGYNLDLLVQHSNVQLRQLARRYRLQRGGSELGLLVVDTEMGDELRSVYSLSGGETFLISWPWRSAWPRWHRASCASSRCSSTKASGSLDPESLQLAMDALDNLQAQGRKVAVISHVQEMHERIPVRCGSSAGQRHEQPEGGRLSRPPRRHVRTAARSVHPEHAAAALPLPAADAASAR